MWKFTVILARSSSSRSPRLINLPSQLQAQWQSCEVIAAVFSTLSLAVATVDYEMRYSLTRNNDNCSVNTDVSEALRWVLFGLTIPAVFFIIGRYTIKRRWLLLKAGEKAKARKAFETFRKWKFLLLLMCGEISLLCVFPYPNMPEVPINLGERRMVSLNGDGKYSEADYCFLLSELLYALMTVRVFFIVRACINYSMFADNTARRICSQFDEVADLSFNYRALARSYPHGFVLVMVLLFCYVFSTAIRVFERPYLDITRLDYDVMFNSMWYTVSTLYTAPYGDYWTQTYLGRTVAFILAILSLCVVSVAYTLMSDFMDLSRKEMETFENIKITRYAAKVIERWYIYIKLRKKLSKTDANFLRLHFIKAADQFSYQLPRLSHRVGLSERILSRKYQQLVDLDYRFFRIDGKMGMGLKKLERDVSHIKVMLLRLAVLLPTLSLSPDSV